ncbi:MAG TPA: fatty acid--CoA ligase family protein [Verrucomicrobiae bacterium]|nr:fatty acid--CoA ligase family protein [Verrucomicrobiae bacterium]
MLYDRWLRIARQNRARLALRDLASGEQWTFSQLAQARPPHSQPTHGLCCPRGNRASFILELLDGWRAGRIVCPLEAGQSPPNLPAPPAETVHLKFTSATTQRARLVAFTAEQLAADADHIVATMGLRPDWPNLGVISLAHSYGFSNLVLPLLLHGVPLFLLEAAWPEMVRPACSLAPHLTLAAVPALWRAWHEASALPANLRLAISAGAPLPLPLETAIYGQCGLKIHNFYGATECGGIAYDSSAVPRQDASCIGAPLQDVRLSLDSQGCLEVRGAAVGSTYWPTPAATLDQGCYRTSDLADLRDGMVYLRGRAGDQINVAGRKVSPESIEHELLRHERVQDCLVFGAPSPEAERSEMVVACVVVEPSVRIEDLRQFLLERLPAWQVPREWRVVESLSPNQRGKLSRTEWRKRLGYVPAAS